MELSQVDSFYTFQTLAFNFRTFRAMTPALEYSQKALEIMSRLDPENVSARSWAAPFYISAGEYGEALALYKKDVVRFKNSQDTLELLKLYNDMGFTFSLDMKSDSAIKYYKKVIDFEMHSAKYKGVLGLASGNLGVIYLQKGAYEQALENLEIDARLNRERDVDSYYNAVNAIGECYVLQRNYERAKEALLPLEKVKPTENRSRLKTYDLLAESYEKTHQPSRSLVYLKKRRALKQELDSSEIPMETLLSQLTEAKVNGIKKDLEISKGRVDLMNSELLLSQSEVKTQKTKTRIYLGFILLSIGVLILFIQNYKTRQEKNQKIHELETELITAELNSKKQDLTNLVTNLSYVRKFIDKSEEKLKQVMRESDGKSREEISSLIRDFRTYKSADKSIAVLQSDIETVNLAFFQKLEEKFPALTANERELCGLLMLKLSSKDIAVIRNVSPNAVKKARQRIRKKLPISESEKISKFLQTI